MSFSVGILYSVQEFLRFIKSNPTKKNQFIEAFQTFKSVSPTLIMEVTEKNEWAKIDQNENIEITKKGNEILSELEMKNALRVQIRHLIENLKPSWSFLIHKGRKEAFQHFPSNVQQCFKEAELINSYDKEVVKWWDILSSISRDEMKTNQLEIGRKGEELSLKYEIQRTGKQVLWQAIESNLAGYDLLSCVSSTNSNPLLIEVKATIKKNGLFTFYLTRNEWSVAQISKHYYFHFWILSENPELYIVDKKKLESHVPINKGSGCWEKIKLEFDTKILKTLADVSSS